MVLAGRRRSPRVEQAIAELLAEAGEASR